MIVSNYYFVIFPRTWYFRTRQMKFYKNDNFIDWYVDRNVLLIVPIAFVVVRVGDREWIDSFRFRYLRGGGIASAIGPRLPPIISQMLPT